MSKSRSALCFIWLYDYLKTEYQNSFLPFVYYKREQRELGKTEFEECAWVVSLLLLDLWGELLRLPKHVIQMQ